MNAALLSHSLAWTLLYSLWQGLLIYGILFVLLKAMPDINAKAKYNLATGAFAAMFAWFADTWVLQYEKLKGTVVYITVPATENGGVITHSVTSISAPQMQTSLLHRLLPGMERYYTAIILIYCTGLVFMLVRFLVNVLQVRTLKKQGIVAPGEQWDEFIGSWQKQFKITRTVKLFLSTHVNVPMMLGTLRPVILMPVAAMNHLSTEQVEAILLHELAHIKRHDYLLNMLQTLGETILFFNPFVWLISAVARKEREHCCDDLVVESAANPLPYARALAILEDSRVKQNGLALAATGNKNQLFHRIKRIMEMKKNNLNYSQLTIIIVAFIAITFAAAMFTFTPSFAQKAKKSTPADTTKKSVYKYKKVMIDDNGKKTVEERVSDKPIKDMADEGGEEVTVSYKDDTTGRKMRKEIIIAHKDRDNIVIDLDGNYDEIMKESYEKIEEAMKKGKAELEKLNNPELQKQIFAEIEAALKEAKDGLDDAKKELAQAKKEMRTTRKIIIGNGSSLPDLPDEEDIALPPTPPAPPTPPGSATSKYKVSHNEYEKMLELMTKDKLIDRNGTYSIKHANGELYINGEKQPADIYNKYKTFLKDKMLTIKGHKGGLTIDVRE